MEQQAVCVWMLWEKNFNSNRKDFLGQEKENLVEDLYSSFPFQPYTNLYSMAPIVRD